MASHRMEEREVIFLCLRTMRGGFCFLGFCAIIETEKEGMLWNALDITTETTARWKR